MNETKTKGFDMMSNTTNEEIQEQEYAEAIEALKETINESIQRSINHDESVKVFVDASIVDLTDAYRLVFLIADDCDSARENAKLEDVWGSLDGEDFRLKLYS